MKRWTNTIVLMVVTAGLILIGVHVADAQPAGGKGMMPGNEPGFAMNRGHGPMGLMGSPNLSDQQLEQMRDLKNEMQMSQIKMMQEQKELRDELLTLADDPDANRNRLGEIQKRMSDLHLQNEKERVSHEEKMQNVLTDEQWEEFAGQRAEHMKTRSEMDVEGRGAGFRGKRGPGYGMHKGSGMQGQGFGPAHRGSYGWGR